MINRIYVFGNMGFMNELPKSGGQSSVRRVMQGFNEEGIETITIRRHRAEAKTRIGHILEVGYFAFYDWFKMIAKMAFRRRKDTAFMQMTYAGALVPYELLLSVTARLMGFKSMEYLQGGLVMDSYPRKGKLHQWMYKANMNLQSLVCFEGYDALALTEAVTKKPKLVYLPSYVRDEVIPSAAPVKPTDSVNLCYFGRLNPVKHPVETLKIFEILCERHPEKKFTLTIVGSDIIHPDYVARLDQLIKESPYTDRITRKENSPFEYLLQMMQTQHFYVFPTNEKAEGHSNALNEAMSQGLIPVATDYHFNKTIIGDARMVVEGYNPVTYADKIDWILDNCNMQELSEQMWKRVKENYAYSIVNHNVCEQIKAE